MLAALIAQLTPSTTSGSGLETLVYIFVGVFALAGVGGIASVYRLIRKSGVRDANIDKTVEAVLNPESGTVVKMDKLTTTQARHGETLARIEHKLSVNGLDSQNVGDIAKRVEIALKDIDFQVRQTNTKLDQHIGQHDERDAQLDRRVLALEKP